MSSSSARARRDRPPRPTSPRPASTSCSWRRPRSRARRSAATASPHERSDSWSPLGIDLDQPGWIRNQGLRIVGGGHRLELPWPDLADYPSFGLVRTRMDFDEILARHAQKAGARLHERTAVTGPILDDSRPHRRRDCQARRRRRAARSATRSTFRAPIVVAADGNSTRLSLAMGLQKRDNRPMGVAVRTYYRSPRHDDDWLESWLELWDGKPRREQPAARLRLDLRCRRRDRQRRPRHPQHLVGLPERRLQGPAQALARQHAGGVGLPRREHGRTGPWRGIADGLQPQAALRQRDAARRRRRRDGQPLQRRGHRVRHGVRRDGGRRHHAGAQPNDPGGPRARAAGVCRRRSTSGTAATTRSAGSS